MAPLITAWFSFSSLIGPAPGEKVRCDELLVRGQGFGVAPSRRTRV